MSFSWHGNSVLQGKSRLDLVNIGIFAVFHERHCGYHHAVFQYVKDTILKAIHNNQGTDAMKVRLYFNIYYLISLNDFDL